MSGPAGRSGGRGPALLKLARAAILETLGRVAPGAAPAPDGLERPGASFVTLRIDGALRGCIGSLEPRRPLYEDVRANARSAAFEDPRFPPLEAGEVDGLSVEVSLLSPLEPIAFGGEEELLAALRPGTDGVCLTCGHHRGLFLPQVWEQLPAPRDFLRGLKRKAGLAPDFWSPEVEAWRFTVEKFAEPPPGDRPARDTG